MVLQTKPEILIDSKNPMGSVMNAIADGLDPDSYLMPDEIEEVTLARTRMRNFIKYTFPDYVADLFHLMVCDEIDRVVSGDLTHLMLFAPPQTGKSEIVSTRLPGFWLAHNPDKPVLLTSYGDALAVSNSRSARDVVDSPAYETLFGPWGLRPNYRRKWREREWGLEGHKDGYVWATGMEGRVTGKGFGLGIIDDPTKGWVEAQSEVKREKQWMWWQGTLVSRFWPGHRMVLMTTRWVEDGIEAKILQQEGNIHVCKHCGKYMPNEKKPERCPKCGGPRGKWKTLSFPAFSESQEERDLANKNLGLPAGLPDPLARKKPGLSMSPQRRSVEFFKDTEIRVGPIVWSASYQQHPTAPKGDLFKVGRIEVAQAYPVTAFGGTLQNQGTEFRPNLIPAGLKRCIRFWDMAATEPKDGSDPDWTVGALVGLDPETLLLWILHVVRARGAPENIVELIKGTTRVDGKGVKVRIEQEGGASGKKLINDYIRILIGYDVAGVPVTGDKYVRAIPLAAQVNAGNVRILEGEWNAPWTSILANFPRGKHDDDVDATAGALNEITEPTGLKKVKFKSLRLKSGQNR